MNPSGGTTLKKLVCQLCKNTIADNPKSVGIRESCGGESLRAVQQ